MTTADIVQPGTEPLFERLGASAGIRRIVDGMVDAHLRNPVIKARFHPYLETPDRVESLRTRGRGQDTPIAGRGKT